MAVLGFRKNNSLNQWSGMTVLGFRKKFELVVWYSGIRFEKKQWSKSVV